MWHLAGERHKQRYVLGKQLQRKWSPEKSLT
jgi:hypothetical protein